ncbi:MAG: hypothetical protein ABJK11_16495 [Balneola sp.]
MALNADSFGGMSNFDFSDMGGASNPPRKIQLSKNDAEKVIEAKEKFNSLDLDIDSLFTLFTDWQTSKTKSVKRFVISISFLLTLALIAGANIVQDIEVLRVPISDGHEEQFLIALFIIHFSAFLYYMYLIAIDFSVQQAKIDTIEGDLEECEGLVHEIDKIIIDNKIQSAGYLFNDFTSPLLSVHRTEEKVYEAVKFYSEKLKKSNKWKKWSDRSEVILLYLLYSAGIVSIISSFYG